ncbi:hypothetical protein AAFP35_15230 [Gordonia sp. CPCC 206044]|uniref:hypothetical protein n=1 Tax=Gordonia sp. CPCC 206044 TaxID=3140793 RepID=UPI003AF3F033
MARDLVEGMTFATPAAIAVDTDLVAGFAAVLGGSDDFLLPVLFRVSTVLAQTAIRSGTVPHDGLVHTAESMRIRREPRLGDRLSGLLTVETITHRAGATCLQVRSDIVAEGESAPIAVATSTLAFRTPTGP